MTGDWEISRPTGKCAVTERVLGEGECYFAALFETPEGLVRRDYAEAVWTGPPEGCFCHWRGRVPVREKKATTIVAVDRELLLQIFMRLEDAESEAQRQFRFVLALLLMRKRVLKLENTVREAGQEYWELRVVGDESATTHRVLNPRLSPQQVDRLNAQVLALLGGDVEVVEALEQEPVVVSAGDTRPEVVDQSVDAGTTQGQRGGVTE